MAQWFQFRLVASRHLGQRRCPARLSRKTLTVSFNRQGSPRSLSRCSRPLHRFTSSARPARQGRRRWCPSDDAKFTHPRRFRWWQRRIRNPQLSRWSLGFGQRTYRASTPLYARDRTATRVRVLASGEVDESMLDALDLYIQLQKKRLERERKIAKGST
jgi:hypothetical protein